MMLPLFFCLLALPGPLGAAILPPSAPAAAARPLPAAGEDEPEKPPVYPRLTALQKDQATRLLVHFKDKNDERKKEPEQDMIDLGRGVIPFLVDSLIPRFETQRESIFRCLEKLTDSSDFLLLKKVYRSSFAGQRLFVVKQVASFREERLHDFLEGALKDEDPQVRLEAALGLAAVGRPTGIGEILGKLAEAPDEPAPSIAAALAALKGSIFAGNLYPYIEVHKDPKMRIATVKAILLIGDERLKYVLAAALDDPHNLVQTAVVNALRQLVKGEPPLENATLFDLVEEVNRWRKEFEKPAPKE